MTEPRPAPYPSTTRAKGWRFELDMERARQSDTWVLATPEARPWLLMLWTTAWEQTPCGSLPNDDELIAARIGMPAKLFAKHRSVLLRKWWPADDGRLYHSVLVQRVAEMMKTRRSESDRKAAARARDAAMLADVVTPESGVVPVLSSGTDAGLHPESGTGTGTRTRSKAYGGPPCAASTGAQPGPPPSDGEYDESAIVGSATPTAYGAISRALRQAGISNAQPSLMRFRMLVDAGAQQSEFLGFVDKALGIQGDRFAYIVGAVEGERKRALATAGQLHRGPMPNRQEAIEQRNAAVGDAWLAEHGAA